MPPTANLTVAPRLERLFNASLNRLFYCSRCSPARLRTRSKHQPQRRNASNLSSSTAINGTKPIPPRYRALYAALTDVRKKASAQVNLSRLQLALQGLESDSPPTRIAILGLNVADTARRIVRLLLSDALDQEESWETQLASGEEDYNNGLIIRYGHSPNASLPPSRTSVPTIHILSNVLLRNNLEIMISSITAESPEISTNASTTSDAFLSPMVGTPTSATGRQVLINQPVHRTLLVANGLDELISISQILARTNFSSSLDRAMIDVAVDLPSAKLSNTTSKTIILDARKAEQGLAAIRRSLSEASTFEQYWNGSGIPTLSQWLINSTQPAAKTDLITSLLSSTSANLHAQQLTATNLASRSSLSSVSQTSLEEAITAFSASAHDELQSSLSSAWSSRNWRKLSWWKLFWRVDDVGLIISDLVTNAWLPATEKAVYELCGRLKQEGIESVDLMAPLPAELVEIEPEKTKEIRHTIPPEVPYPDEKQPISPNFHIPKSPTSSFGPMTSTSPARAFSSDARPVLASPDGQHVSVRMEAPPTPFPLSTIISSVRNQTMVDYIASLTITAQQLVLRTLSISGLSAGLSGLLYISVTAGSMYEAGTVVALGTAYALRKMQTDWGIACRGLEDGLRAEGREVIKRIEEGMRVLVREKAKVMEDPVEVEIRREADEAVERAQVELRKVLEGEGDDKSGKE